MLLSQAIENIDQEISQLYTQVAAHKDHQSTLIELDAKADDLLEHLEELVAKVKYHAPDEIDSLRNAVLNLFDGDDNNNHPNNQPTLFTPETTLLPETIAHNQQSPVSMTSANSTPDEPPYVELVQHSQNKALAYQRQHDSQIVCVYLGCNSISRIKSWSEWLYRQNWGLTRTECNNSRKALCLTEFKYELKLPALSKERINQLAKHNFSSCETESSGGRIDGIKPHPYPKDWGKRFESRYQAPERKPFPQPLFFPSSPSSPASRSSLSSRTASPSQEQLPNSPNSHHRYIREQLEL